LVSLTDRRPARRIFLASSALNVFCCFGIALCDGLLPALGFRAVAGIAFAGMYVPGLHIQHLRQHQIVDRQELSWIIPEWRN
jgi:hypothetical protein